MKCSLFVYCAEQTKIKVVLRNWTNKITFHYVIFCERFAKLSENKYLESNIYLTLGKTKGATVTC